MSSRCELADRVWAEMPLLRKHLIGRKRIDWVVELAIDRAPLEVLPYVRRCSKEEDVVRAAWQSAVKMRYCTTHGEDAIQFGPLFWIIMAPLIQHAIKTILEWWLESRRNRVLLAGWRREGIPS